MAERVALVDGTGKVVNIVKADESWTPPAGLTAVPAADVAVPRGGTWDGTTFTPPVRPPDPQADARARADELAGKQRGGTDLTQAEVMEYTRLQIELGRL